MKKLNIVTYQNLINVKACDKGVVWFKKNYPNGIKVTKQNIKELIIKLLRRKSAFVSDVIVSVRWDTPLSMAIFVDAVFNEEDARPSSFDRQMGLSTKEYINYLTNDVWMYIKLMEQ